MTFKEFGKVIQERPENLSFKELGEVIEPVSRTKSLLHAPIKGAIKKAADIAEFVREGPPGRFIRKIPGGEGYLKPEEAREYAEREFVTQPKELEKYLERAGGVGLEAALSPGGLVGKAARTAIGAGLGYAAEKLEAPEWAQAVAESVPFFYSGGKKIPLKKDQVKLGEFLRKQGLTENEITPLLKSPEQIERWGKWASKGAKSRELMESIYHKSGQIYSNIEKQAGGLANPNLTSQNFELIEKEFAQIYEKMPHKFRNLIKHDVKDFLNSPGGFNDLKNLYQDINAVIGAEHGGRAVVGLFKKPIQNAMTTISPELANDFELATDLYRTRARVKGSIVSPKEIDKFIDLGEAATFGTGIVNRDIGLITKAMGAVGARKIAREMLINPRLQNISVRIGEALKNNKYVLAEKYLVEFRNEVEKEDPELATTIPTTIHKK